MTRKEKLWNETLLLEFELDIGKRRNSDMKKMIEGHLKGQAIGAAIAMPFLFYIGWKLICLI